MSEPAARRWFGASVLVALVGVVGVFGSIAGWPLAAVDEHDGGSVETTLPRPTTTVATSSTAAPPTDPPTTLSEIDANPLPPGSGEGRRAVFSVGAQRTWWVDHDGTVLRTALVSGRENTPRLGTFQVYSRSERATGLDGSSMNYFVRFTRGENGWAIGFHDIPLVDGVPAQTAEQLGTPLSHGCIRQSTEDALFTWDFLQVGDTVVVVA